MRSLHAPRGRPVKPVLSRGRRGVPTSQPVQLPPLASRTGATGVSRSLQYPWGEANISIARHAPEQRHRQRYCEFSNDPFSVDEVRNIVGRYLSPPDRAVILRVDETSRVQAFNRTRAALPKGVRGQQRRFNARKQTKRLIQINSPSEAMCHFPFPSYPPGRIELVEVMRISMGYGDLISRRRHAFPIPLWDEACPSALLGRELDHAFENILCCIGLPTAWSGAFTPTIDLTLTETDRTIDVMADLPGVREDDLQVEHRDNVLSNNGKRKSETNETGKAMHGSERAFGILRRSIQLSVEVEQDKVEASFADGMLVVSLPKRTSSRNRVRTIEIEDSMNDSDGHPDERNLP